MPISASKSRLLACLVILIALLRFGYVAVFHNRGPVTVVTASGLKYIDLIEGKGATPQSGQMVTVQYRATFENGQEVDSYGNGRPSDFYIGVGSLIEGFEEGVMTMKVGGKRRLIVPPHLAYGPEGHPPSIPPNSTLIFEVELLGVK